MVSLEQSEANVHITNEIINKQEVDLIVKLLKEQKTHLQDKTELGNQMEKIIELLEKDPNIPKVYGKMNLEIAMVQQDMIKVMIGVFEEELKRIKSDLEKDDIQSSSAASELLGLLSDNKTLQAFSVSGKASVTDYLSSLKNGTLWCEVLSIEQCGGTQGLVTCVTTGGRVPGLGSGGWYPLHQFYLHQHWLWMENSSNHRFYPAS